MFESVGVDRFVSGVHPVKRYVRLVECEIQVSSRVRLHVVAEVRVCGSSDLERFVTASS